MVHSIVSKSERCLWQIFPVPSVVVKLTIVLALVLNSQTLGSWGTAACAQGRRHEFHNGGYKIVNSRAKRATKFFVPPIRTSWGGYTMLIMHNYAVNRKFKCLQYQSDATRHLLKRFSPCQTISYFRR